MNVYPTKADNDKSLAKIVADTVRTNSVGDVSVILPADVSYSTVHDILSIPQVVGVFEIIPGKFGNSAQEDTVGGLSALDGWRFPKSVGTALICFVPTRDLPFRFLLEARRLGVRNIIASTISLHSIRGSFQVRPIEVYLAGSFAQRIVPYLSNRLAQFMDRMGSRAPGPVDTPESSGWRVRKVVLAPLAWIERMSRPPRRPPSFPFGPLRGPPIYAPISRRILMVAGSLAVGGTERQVANTMIGLSARGRHDLGLICETLEPGKGDFYLQSLVAHGVGARAARRPAELDAIEQKIADRIARRYRATFSTIPPWIAEDICRYAAEIASFRPEIVHTWLDEMNVKVGAAAAIAGVPKIVLSCRSVAPVNFQLFLPYMREGYLSLVRQPQVRILNNSEAGARDYARWLGIDPARITVLRNGVDDQSFRRSDSSPSSALRRHLNQADGPIVGTVLRFNEEKGPLLWVRTAAQIAARRSDVAFVMVGGGPLLEQAKELAARLGVGDRLVFAGVTSDPSEVLELMDVFLLTSRLEGLPNALIEAQMLGVPVVTTDAGGAAETIDIGVTGYAVKPHDPRSLADRVLAILADQAWRRRARERGPEHIRNRFGMDRMIDETLAVYGDR